MGRQSRETSGVSSFVYFSIYLYLLALIASLSSGNHSYLKFIIPRV